MAATPEAGKDPCAPARGPLMKNLRNRLIIATIFILALTFGVAGTAVIDDQFADGNSQNQDLSKGSLRVFNGRAGTTRTDAPGSVTFDVTAAGGSDAFWAYFTNAGEPLRLGVGDKLAVALTFSVAGFGGTGQDVRFGVFDSLGTRNAGNLSGGMNETSFVNDVGYALQYFASGMGSPFVIMRRTTLTSGNVFNTTADFTPITTDAAGATARQALTNDAPYTLNYTIERLTDANTKITAAVTGQGLTNLSYSVTESSSAPNTRFDYFAFRIAGPAFASRIRFSRMLVDFTPSLPVIVSQPQPANLTVQVGSSVTLGVAATGSNLSYKWERNESALNSNASAATPTLNLTNVQLGDAGDYTCVISNGGGSIRSAAARLRVTTDPVPPPPAITRQPVNTTVTVGGSASLAVTATGEGLVYQWFKDGALLPGETRASLNIANAQIGDTATYTVLLSNSSGSVTSAPARLLVVSAMAATGFAPAGTNAPVDAPLTLRFNQPVRAGRGGKLSVYQEDGVLVDTIDMSLNAQSKAIGPTTFNYFPILTSGDTATISLHKPLAYGKSYYVLVEPGVLTDAGNAPFAGVADPKVLRFTTRPLGPPPGTTQLTVAADGTGDFATVQGAIDFIPAAGTQRITILVRRGTYQEIVYVPSNKQLITVRGEDRDQTVIQYPNNAQLNAGNSRAMFGVDAPDFTLENITLHNTTPKGGSQAEAFRGNNQRIMLNRVTLKSFQDTLLLQGRGFVVDSYIEGDVDFMWGNGAVYFQNCELKALFPGYYTQIRNGQTGNGNVYVNCRLTGVPALTGVYLSRIDPTVFPFSQAVFINCAMGPHILPAGWLLNNAAAAPNVKFWEFGSKDLNGNALDVSQRAAFSRQLTAAEAAEWSNPAFVLGGWSPVTLTASPEVILSDETITVKFTAPTGNRATDWVGLFREGDGDGFPYARLSTNAAVNDTLSFKAPSIPGRYECRYYSGSGARMATSNSFAQYSAPLRPETGPVGFASVNAWGQDGTTGGAGGQTITVSTPTEFLNAIRQTEPLIIQVNGMLTLPGPMHNVTSNKTILGLGANSGFTGGGLNIGLSVEDTVVEPPANAVKNIIVRNLHFTNLPDDAINIQGFSHHIWIDHCDLSNGFDGLIDIKRGSSYVTVSWNRLRNHSKTSLVGSDDGLGAQDTGRLRVTYHHNWFDGTVQRNPRVRYGEPVHLCNNFYLNNSEVGAACLTNSGCVLEGNVFENVQTPITINGPTESGRAVERDNLFLRSGAPIVGGSVQEPRAYYNYTMDNATAVRNLVTQQAGVRLQLSSGRQEAASRRQEAAAGGRK